MLEKDIEAWLNKQIEKMGGIAYKFVSPGNPGVPDRIYILPDGVIWFVELKQQSGRVANLQKWQRKRLLKMGCNYRLVRGMDDAKVFVQQLKGGGESEVHSTRLSEICNREDYRASGMRTLSGDGTG